MEFMSDQCSISASFIRTKCLIILIKMGNITNILSLHLFTIYDLGTISYCWILKEKTYPVKLYHRERPPCRALEMFFSGWGRGSLMNNYLCLVVQGTLIVILLCECNNFDFLLRPHSDPHMAPEENKSNLIFRFFCPDGHWRPVLSNTFVLWLS